MKHVKNSLYVLTQETTLRKESDSVVVIAGSTPKTKIPLIALDAIFCFGRVRCTQQLLACCAAKGIAVNFLSRTGRFLASVQGFNRGNVALRREQFRKADDPAACLAIARTIVEGKIANYRTNLRRAARERTTETSTPIHNAANRLDSILQSVATYQSIDVLRGIEGDATRIYFSTFNAMITHPDPALQFTRRSRRPPLDPINALLSFGYTLLAADMRSACEAAGLDARVGYLHQLRSGRASLALDLMEDFRSLIVDRLVLSLVNRRQVSALDFCRTNCDGMQMTEPLRRVFISAYQRKKQTSIIHPVTNESVTFGECMIMQARSLAKYLSGGESYQSFLGR